MTKLRVGGAWVEFEEAQRWATDYLANNEVMSAYPAYDGYPGSPTSTLGPQDLLAPALLNVSQNPVAAYYGLQALSGPLNEQLARVAPDANLADDRIEIVDQIGRLFDVLDEHPTKYVKLTTLSKVLHRKRPHLVPLFDAHIHWCYTLHRDAPVPEQPGRSKAGYRRAWIHAVRQDLIDQEDRWGEIAAIAPGPLITPLRALDIVGWELGKRHL